MRHQLYKLIIGTAILINFISCKKQEEWLDHKLSKSDVVPTTIDDFQALLDNTNLINRSFPTLGFFATDNFYVTDAGYQLEGHPPFRNAYIWDPVIFTSGQSEASWVGPYRNISISNICLAGLEKIPVNSENGVAYNNVKGTALFFRAYSLYCLVQLFSKHYDAITSSSDPGIPIPLTGDINELTSRGTVQQVYDQIIKDLKEAEELLIVSPVNITRPSKPAAQGALARVFLSMGDYVNAELNADKALAIKGGLIDFNTLDPAASFSPFPGSYDVNVTNPEVILFAAIGSSRLANAYNSAISIVDSTLYEQYHTDDLRRVILFRDFPLPHVLKGAYTGQSTLFGGIATNELYFISAEAKARQNKLTEAVNLLNQVLEKRFKTGFFTPHIPGTQQAILSLILTEKNKELPFTGQIRWEDLRRLNKDPNFAKTLVRVVNGQTYTLPPNDNRYVFPLPPDEILLHGLQQNPR